MKRLSNEDVAKGIYELVGNEYSMLSDYKNNKTNFKMRHNTCGYEFLINWSNFKIGNRCAKCAGNYRYSDEEITSLIEDGGEYKKLSNYKNKDSKMLLQHISCGHLYEASWNSFRNGNRCPSCAGNIKYTENEVSNMISKLSNEEYIKLGEYRNANLPMLVKHLLCGYEYKVSLGAFKNGRRCPKCNQSKGEKFIFDYLTNNDIPFSSQVKFEDCKYKATLPFDFGILSDEDKIIALLEYDGLQHFKPVKAWGGEENLKLTQCRDLIKNNYCKKNNIPLLWIKYNENIEEKLNVFLNSILVKEEMTS